MSSKGFDEFVHLSYPLSLYLPFRSFQYEFYWHDFFYSTYFCSFLCLSLTSLLTPSSSSHPILSLLFSLASFPLSRSQLWISFAELAHSWLTNIQRFRCQRAPPSLLKTFLRFVSNESAKVIKINFYFEQKCISPFTKVFNHEEGSNIP